MRQKRRDARSGPGMTMSTQPPTGGTGQPKISATIVLAFSPVVTRVWQDGM